MCVYRDLAPPTPSRAEGGQCQRHGRLRHVALLRRETRTDGGTGRGINHLTVVGAVVGAVAGVVAGAVLGESLDVMGAADVVAVVADVAGGIIGALAGLGESGSGEGGGASRSEPPPLLGDT